MLIISTMLKLNLFVLNLALLSIPAMHAVRPEVPLYHYTNVEDYLTHMNKDEQSWVASKDKEISNREQEQEIPLDIPTSNATIPLPSGLKKDKKVTCCILGQIAGDKGFHCYVNFYAARIIMRNYNRAHNRKIAFHGHEQVPNYGQKLMRTFEQCVASEGAIFHKCCHLAAGERRKQRYDTRQHRLYLRRNKHPDVTGARKKL
ncbi:uncharacterized protein LOC106457083 [Limulus polyphemus]|uniref:Uncharacterized protein LOC106457083 n=1 Tax=Limulus polyphemus TaxID=6850 RepID=A0ABM1AZV3_LIMPO|nr:uncharacterized protein LOC106457083 [Limulus polyphemus]